MLATNTLEQRLGQRPRSAAATTSSTCPGVADEIAIVDTPGATSANRTESSTRLIP